METKKLISVGESIAIAIFVLGVICNVMTFTPWIRDALACLTKEEINIITYICLVCGTSFMGSASLLIILLKRTEEYPFLILPLLIIGAFLGISGILAVLYMLENPVSWVAFLLNLSMFGVILKLIMIKNK